MTSVDRTSSSIHGKEIDAIPVFPILLAPACQLLGVKQRDYFKNSDVMADTLLKARELCGFDGIYVSRDNWVYHQALGGELQFPEDDETFSREPVLKSLADWRDLQIPNPWNAPGMSTVLEAADKVVAQAGEEFYIQANIDCGPFSLGAVLRGAETFMMDLYSADRSELLDFLSFCTEVVVEYGKAMIKTGVHGIQMGDATAGLLSPELFHRFVLPYLKAACAGLAGDECDLWLHICGKTDHILEDIGNLPIDGFEVDAKVPLDTAHRLLGKDIALKGNIDTTFILHAEESEVYEACVDLIETTGMRTGFILSPGCGVPKMTPLANLKAMVRACRDYPL